MVNQNGRFSFLLTITRFGHLAKIRQSIWISISQRVFVCLMFFDRFRVVHILFVHMVKFRLFAQFSVDHYPHPFMSSLIVSLRVFHMDGNFTEVWVDSKYSQFSRTLLSIRSNHSSAVVWTVSILAWISSHLILFSCFFLGSFQALQLWSLKSSFLFIY